MAFGKNRNRRRQDLSQRREELKGAVHSHGPSALKGLLLAGLTAALVWGGVELRRWALSSPTFLLKETTFSGLQRSTASELLRLAGLTQGQNLFSLDVEALERGMQAHPWVRSVEVTRHFPSSVAVEVVEHAPEALVALGDLYLVDGEGEPFKRVTAGDRVDLPLVTGVEREAYLARPEEVRERLRQALEVARAYAETRPGPAERLSEVRLGAEGLALLLVSGQEVRLGEGEVQAKLARLVRLREELGARGLSAEVIHLDNRARPGWVAVRISSPASTGGGTRAP